MEPENLTLRILGEMREEMRAMRAELGGEIRGLKEDIREIRDHLGVVDERLSVIEDTMVDLASQVHILGRGTRVTLDAKKRHEALIADIDRRVTAIEREQAERGGR